MFYDKLGRITEKKLGTTTVADYTYDTAPGKGIGQPASVTGNNNISYSYQYDNLGRVYKETENIQGESFTTETSYNNYSQPQQIKYPGNTVYTVENNYQNGYISTVKGTHQTTDDIFTASSYNPRGQITGYSLGNGLSTTRGYDEYGFPTTIQTPGIQNLAYEFNPLTGNLNWRKDVAKNIQEDFTYDNLMKNRLETWQVNSGDVFTAQYDANGNISSKTWLGSFYYQGTQPHAVTGVDNTDNWIETQEQTNTYTPFNKVRTIREGDYKLEIIYGPDNQRKKTILYRDANSPTPLKSSQEQINWVPYKTKYYVGGIYEEETTDALFDNHRELNYIYGGDGLAAIFVSGTYGDSLYYIHKDHLGSFQAVTNQNGILVEEMNFDPWGNRRNPASWSYPAGEDYYLFHRGFTGHEHLDQFKLINMNGRVYDPILGRFLSPDNYIQVPDYSQSLNRYSYCINNPLKYTDPTGEWFGFDDGVAFLIGGVVNLGSNLIQGNIDNLGEGLAAFGAGGVAGTLALYGPAGWAAGGAIVGGTNAWVSGAQGWDIVQGAGIGAFSGLAGGAVGQWAAQGLGNVVVQGLNITSPVLKGVVGGTIGGAAGGYAGGFTGGLLATGDLSAAHQAGMSGMATGAPIGGVAGGIGGYAYAKKNDINPWTGRYSKPLYHYTTENNANTIMNSQLGYDDNSWNYLTPDGTKTPIQAQIDLALPQSNTAKSLILVKPNSIFPNNFIMQGNVQGNFYFRGGGGYEIIYQGTINSQYLLRIK